MSGRSRMPSPNQGVARIRRLDRIECPHCGMAIVPRLAFYDGTPTKSVCPFCAGIVRDFRPLPETTWIGAALKAFAVLLGLTLVLGFLDQLPS